jgi:aryl carrier-like protein
MNPTSVPQVAPAVRHEVLDWLRAKLEDDDIAGDDNFLAVGGHSMLAIELNAWLTERHRADIDLAVLFRESLNEAVDTTFGDQLA